MVERIACAAPGHAAAPPRAWQQPCCCSARLSVPAGAAAAARRLPAAQARPPRRAAGRAVAPAGVTGLLCVQACRLWCGMDCCHPGGGLCASLRRRSSARPRAAGWAPLAGRRRCSRARPAPAAAAGAPAAGAGLLLAGPALPAPCAAAAPGARGAGLGLEALLAAHARAGPALGDLGDGLEAPVQLLYLLTLLGFLVVGAFLVVRQARGRAALATPPRSHAAQRADPPQCPTGSPLAGPACVTALSGQ